MTTARTNYVTPPYRTAIVADVASNKTLGETKIHFVIDGKVHAFRCDTEDLATLIQGEGEVIRKITL